METVFNFRCVGQVEIDDPCLRTLTRHWPTVPKFKDIQAFDGTEFKGVDAVIGGFPCQDLSAAGRKAGLKGERSGLFFELARVVREVGPRFVLLENVRGLLTAGGFASDERGAAMGEVLGTLSDIGFRRVEWVLLGASDVGAPHRRHRIFILASDPDHSGLQGHAWDGTDSHQQGRFSPEPNRLSAPTHLRTSADSDSPGSEARSHQFLRTGPDGQEEPLGDGGETASDTDRGRRKQHDEGKREVPEPDPCGPSSGNFPWGIYEPAIRQWEQLTSQEVPYPTDEKQRLAPEFVEWVQGFPVGWTTGESRTNRLKQLGNAVVPQQASAALRHLLKEDGCPVQHPNQVV